MPKKKDVVVKPEVIEMSVEASDLSNLPDETEDEHEIDAMVLDPKVPMSDMEMLSDVVRKRLKAEGLRVNTDALPTVEIKKDFVDDCTAMIPPNGGILKVRVTCVIAKGYDTETRLILYKDSVRRALMNEPLRLRNYAISSIVMREDDSRLVGVRKSVLTVQMKVGLK